MGKTVCLPSFTCWRCTASASSYGSAKETTFFLLLEERALWFAVVPFYEDTSARDLSHFVLFYTQNQLWFAVSHSKGFFPALTAAYSSFLFPPPLFIVSWRSVGIDAKYYTINLHSAECAGDITLLLLFARSLLIHPKVLTTFLNTFTVGIHLVSSDTRNPNYSCSYCFPVDTHTTGL